MVPRVRPSPELSCGRSRPMAGVVGTETPPLSLLPAHVSAGRGSSSCSSCWQTTFRALAWWQGRSWITCLPGRKFISTVGADLSQEWVQGGAGVPQPLGPPGPLHPNKPTLAASPPVASPSHCPALLAPPPSSQATHAPPEHLWPWSHCLLPLIPGLRTLGWDGGLGFSGHRELGSGLCKHGKPLAMAAAEVNPTPLSPILVTTDKAQLGTQCLCGLWPEPLSAPSLQGPVAPACQPLCARAW